MGNPARFCLIAVFDQAIAAIAADAIERLTCRERFLGIGVNVRSQAIDRLQEGNMIESSLYHTFHGLDVTEMVGAIEQIEGSVTHLVVFEHGLLIGMIAIADRKYAAIRLAPRT